MAQEEKTLKSNLIYKGKILDLYKDEIVCDNGEKSFREYIDHNGGVCILGFVDNKVVLVKQFRYSYKEIMLELPAGKIEKGENPSEAAKREFEEEAGYRVNKITELGATYPSCGYTNEIIYLYLAEELVKTHTHFDRDENIELVYLPLEEVFEKIDNGTIKDAKTIALMYHYLRRK